MFLILIKVHLRYLSNKTTTLIPQNINIQDLNCIKNNKSIKYLNNSNEVIQLDQTKRLRDKKSVHLIIFKILNLNLRRFSNRQDKIFSICNKLIVSFIIIKWTEIIKISHFHIKTLLMKQKNHEKY